MTTPASALAAVRRPAPPAAFHPAFFAALLALGIAGFWPSYFARLADTDFTHHLHGASATAWMLLLVTQASLVRMRRTDLHRPLGRVSFVLVPLFLFSGVLMVRSMVTGTNGFSRAFGPALAFVDITSLIGFATAYLLAIRHRRTLARHARWMAITGVMILPPALARLLANQLPGIGGFVPSVHVAYLIAEAIALAMLVADRRRQAPVAPSASLLGLMLLQHAGFTAILAMRAGG